MGHLRFGLLILILGCFACTSARVHPGLQLTPESEYFALVKSNTAHSQQYDGLVAILDVRATRLTADTARAQLDHFARLYQYGPEKYAEEKAALEQRLAQKTEFFVSFFVPDRKLDDLNKGNSKWKIFWDVGGKRYEGTATKLKLVLAEVSALYPEHTRWGTPYSVSFPIPTAQGAQAGNLTFTGPVSSTTLQLP